MARRYWLDLFTGKTWEEFLNSDRTVSGFRIRREKLAQRVKPGDYLICYLTGISRFVGVLEVKSESYLDQKTKIWEDELFPVRFKVNLLYHLTPATAVPALSLRDKLSLFGSIKNPKAWSGFFRGSPVEFPNSDGQIVAEAIRAAVDKPVAREYDKTKYLRKPKYESNIGLVTVPDDKSRAEAPAEPKAEPTSISHEEIQWLLLKLGSDLGLDVWVARNDKNREHAGNKFQSIPHIINAVPRQFDDATNKTIELIDVLWLQGDAIIAAFEVEHTTQIFSGLLRMSDLLAMQPNLKIDLYIVAPDDRREKVMEEVNRPTFSKLHLPQTCKFIPYSDLKTEVQQIGHRVRYMSPSFIENIAETCEPEEA